MRKKQTLTTFIGGVIDKMSYGKIAFCIIGLLLFCSTYFWLFNPYKHGTNMAGLNWMDSLYFCIITFSSLGYGDIAPIGFGKAIASFQVLSGITLTAIFVGKIASERQAATLRLLYTSENQRRIVEYEKEIDELDSRLDVALTEHNHDELYLLSKSIYRFIASINNYLNFHSTHGDLASAGNTSSLRRLYQSMTQLQRTVYEAARSYGIQPKTKNKLDQIITRITNVATIMLPFHKQDEKINSALTEILFTKENLDKWNQQLRDGTPEYKYRSELSPYLLNKVKEAMPIAPWPKNVQKIVAAELNIHNKLAQRCIDKLITDGHFH